MRTVALAPLLCTLACAAEDRIEVRFASAAQRDATTEMRVFLFGGPEQAAPGCPRVDPRGLPPGDAPARTGLAPASAQTGPLRDTIAELGDVPTGDYTLVIEAWGPPCATVRNGDTEPVCAELVPTEPSVLRAYYCNDFTLGTRRLDVAADLESFADVGATMRVPTAFPAEAERYDADAPLLVADGLPARDRFLVQLLSGNADELDDVAVRFTVEEGAGQLIEAQPVLTGPEPEIQDQGLAGAVLRADAFASKTNDGALVVSAYAPGFEGAPIRFYARALPNVEVTLETQQVPLGAASMRGVDPRAVLVALDDLDGDQRLDLITTSGGGSHRLLVHYGGQPEVHVSPEQPLQARALTVARLSPGVPSVLVSTARERSSVRVDTVHGNTFVVEDPRLEIWSGFTPAPADGALPAPQSVLTELDGAPIEKMILEMTAKDIDGDGVDEIATSRCSYLYQTDAGQNNFIRCLGRVIDKTDSEIALLAVGDGGELTVKATIRSVDNQGGYREVAFSDVNADSSFDLVFTSNSQVHGVCGRRFQGAVGFGFDGATPFEETHTAGAGYAVATGRFDGDEADDLVVTNAIRASSTTAGFKTLGGGSCDRFDPGPPPFTTGPKTQAHMLSIRAADLNADGFDDVLLLHRNTRKLRVFFGGGNLDFAAGPVLELPTGDLGELAIGEEAGSIVAATVAPRDNALLRIRFSPR